MTPAQEKLLAEKMDGWTCEDQMELWGGVSGSQQSESGAGKEEQPR